SANGRASPLAAPQDRGFGARPPKQRGLSACGLANRREDQIREFRKAMKASSGVNQANSAPVASASGGASISSAGDGTKKPCQSAPTKWQRPRTQMPVKLLGWIS